MTDVEYEQWELDIMLIENNILHKALAAIASLPYGKTEGVDEGHEQAYRAIENLIKREPFK